MTHSDNINELAAALAKAQAVMAGAKRDADNPFFKSKYADLASVWDACRKALTDNGISVSQSPSLIMLGEPEVIARQTRSGEERDIVRGLAQLTVSTLLMHSSGQWLCDSMTCVLPSSDPQSVGSGTTYLRRYALAAFVGVAPEDDDAEAAQGRSKGVTAMSVPQPKRPLSDGPLVVVPPVLKKETSRKNFFKYTVTFSDGRSASTVKEQLASLAAQLSETGEEVVAVIEEGKYGPDLVELRRATPDRRPEPIPVPEPVNANDIPF